MFQKASQSMRTIPKPTDQCDSSHFSKFAPRHHRNHRRIEFKAPLPCHAPTYRPSVPKKANQDDWTTRRSHIRAQLRSRV
uniref:Uncharacterized protein n=2 Tax=Caenorhabditis japonica TaxID=281687 RepID=A0A8R1E9G9_CAEJA